MKVKEVVFETDDGEEFTIPIGLEFSINSMSALKTICAEIISHLWFGDDNPPKATIVEE